MSRLGIEIVAGPVAVQQALFFHYGLSIRQIAALVGRAYTTVYWNVWRERAAVIPWNMRKHKAEAISRAAKLLESQ